MLPDEFDILYNKFLDNWMSAEEALKKTERLRNEVFFPSINELRYAARRVVEAHIAFNSGIASADDIKVHLIEASENCRKAKHDAVDASINFIHEEFKEYEKIVGLSMISRAFPNYTKLTGTVLQVDQCIIQSRKDRSILDDEYEDIVKKYLPMVVDLYFEMKTSVKIARQLQKADRKNLIFGSVVIGLLLALLILFFDKNEYFDWMILGDDKPTITDQEANIPSD